MKRKSKLLTFISSIIPGFGQIYLGHSLRGIMFLGAIIANFIFFLFLMVIVGINSAPVVLIGWPIIWLVAMADSLILCDRYNNKYVHSLNNSTENVLTSVDEEEIKTQNRKVIAMILSIVPGVGHMYLGLQKQGLQLISIFFFTFFFVDWLRISFLMFIIPIVWFYSMFDVFNKSTKKNLEDSDIGLIAWIIENDKTKFNGSKILAYILIGIGLVLLLERIAIPMIGEFISWKLTRYIHTAFISFLFIIGGIKMLLGKNEKSFNNEEEEEE